MHIVEAVEIIIQPFIIITALKGEQEIIFLTNCNSLSRDFRVALGADPYIVIG